MGKGRSGHGASELRTTAYKFYENKRHSRATGQWVTRMVAALGGSEERCFKRWDMQILGAWDAQIREASRKIWELITGDK